MKHVAKQDWMGCAVATVAMLGELTYEEVAARPLLPALDRTRWPREMWALLEDVTASKWRVSTFWFRPPALAQFPFPEWPVAAFVQDSPWRPRFGQWVVVKRELVHDPGEIIVYTVNKYPRRDWRVVCLAQPRRPAAFAREQARRRIDTVRQVLQMQK